MVNVRWQVMTRIIHSVLMTGSRSTGLVVCVEGLVEQKKCRFVHQFCKVS